MAELISVLIAVLAALAAVAALWLARRATRDAKDAYTAAQYARRTQQQGTAREGAPERDRGPGDLIERPWRDSTPGDAPEWIRESFATLYELIRDLQREVQRLEGELRRGERAPEGRTSTDIVAPPTPPRALGRRGQPVDLRDGLIVPSRALGAVGSLIPGDGGAPALLYLNESVEIDHLVWDRWSEYFDFGNGSPYRRYRTVEPSQVEWNAATEQGRLIMRGRAEAM